MTDRGERIEEGRRLLAQAREHDASDPEFDPTLVGIPTAEYEALLDVYEAAQRFLDLDYGYLTKATREGLQPLVEALARFAAGPEEGA